MQFIPWLVTQTNRRGAVGCLAITAYQDSCLDKRSTFEQFVDHVREQHEPQPVFYEHLDLAEQAYNAAVLRG